MERFSSDGCKDTRDWGRLVHYRTSSGQQFVNSFIWLMLRRSVLPTYLLNLGPFYVHAVIPLSILETSQDEFLWYSTARQWKLGSPYFSLFLWKDFRETLPSTHIFCKDLTPTNSSLVILSRGELPPKDTVIIFGWAATGYRCVCMCARLCVLHVCACARACMCGGPG